MLRYLAKNTQKYTKLSVRLVQQSVSLQVSTKRHFCFNNKDPFQDDNYIDFINGGPQGFDRFNREPKKKSQPKDDQKNAEQQHSQKDEEKQVKVDKEVKREVQEKKECSIEERGIDPEVIDENDSEVHEKGKLKGFQRFSKSRKKIVKDDDSVNAGLEKDQKEDSKRNLKEDFEEMLKKSFEDDKKPSKKDENIPNNEEDKKTTEKQKKSKRESVYGMKTDKNDKSSKRKNLNKIFNQDKEDSNEKEDEKKNEGNKKQGFGPGYPSFTSSSFMQYAIFFGAAYMASRIFSNMLAGQNGDEGSAADSKVITFDEFLHNYLKNGQISLIKIQRMLNEDSKVVNNLYAEVISGGSVSLAIGDVDHFLRCLEDLQLERGIPQANFVPVSFKHTAFEDINVNRVSKIMFNGFVIIVCIGLHRVFKNNLVSLKGDIRNAGKQDFTGKGGGMGGGGNNMANPQTKSTHKLFNLEKDVKVTFDQVAGLEEAKLEVKEFVDFLKNSEKYTKLGARIPRGALFTGPPGTGKTLMAKACAGESKVPFFYISGSEFVEMYVGVGASRVRKLFKEAKQMSPAIIFIDEIDAIGKKRESASKFGGGNDERETTLNQLLVEMDGFKTDQNVILFAATNIKDSLDPALLRAGRFDRSIDIPLPDITARQEIFKVH